MANQKLSPIEKETIKQFVFDSCMILQKLQECNTYKSVLDAQKTIEAKIKKLKSFDNMDALTNEITKKLKS